MPRSCNSCNDFPGIWDFVIYRTTALKIHDLNDLKRKDIINNHIVKDSILNF